MRVAASGGTPVPVTAPPPPASRRRHVTPLLLPDGAHVLFSDVSSIDAADSRVMVQALSGGDARLVVASASDARLLPSGQLAFMRLGTLMIAGFDPKRAEMKGTALAVLGDVMQSGIRGRAGAQNTGVGMFAVSSLGTLAVVRGAVSGPARDTLAWFDRDGRSTPAEPSSGAPPGGRVWLRISPDQARAIVSVATPMHYELWIADWTRDVWTECRECAGSVGGSVWSPDGRRILVRRDNSLVAHSIDNSTPDQVLVREADRGLVPSDWMADGRILYLSSPEFTNFEVKFLEPGATAGRIVVPLGGIVDATVSPDGRWLAYGTTGRQVMVQTFPGPGPRVQVSAAFGANPIWSADSRTLYYLDRSSEGSGSFVRAVDIANTGPLTASPPREILRRQTPLVCNYNRCHDISSDGRRFLFRDPASAPRPSVSRMDLVLNWTATLAR
jgi:hypothetical protein